MPTGRSRLPANKRTYQIQRLQDSHKEIIRQSVLGKTRQQIADLLGISPVTVTNVRNSELGRQQTEMISGGRDATVKSVSDKIQELLPGAIKVMEGVLEGRLDPPDGGNVTVSQRIDIAKDLVGRGGYVPPTRVQGHIDHEHKFNAADIAGIKERAKLNGYKKDMEIVEVEEVEPAVTEDGNAEDTDSQRDSRSDIQTS